MFFNSIDESKNHDYFDVIINVYPKLKKTINNILNSFELKKDASGYFVDYYSKGHTEIHFVLGEDYPCESVNQLLNDLFFSVIKYERNNENFEIPNLFYNFHAVHYFFKIKEKIDDLYRQNMDEEQIIDSLVLWERKKHQNNECDCGSNHKLLETIKIKEFFLQILEYYYSIHINYDEKILERRSENKEVKFLN